MSASASEILANALLDLKQDVTVIGLPSFGKGKLQISFGVDNSQFAITASKLRAPDGRELDQHSLQPDILLDPGEVFLEFDKDLDIAIQKAIEVIKE